MIIAKFHCSIHNKTIFIIFRYLGYRNGITQPPYKIINKIRHNYFPTSNRHLYLMGLLSWPLQNNDCIEIWTRKK